MPVVPGGGGGNTTMAANPAVPATGRSNNHHHQHGRRQQQQYRGGGGGGVGLHGLGVTDAQWRYHRDLAVEMCRQMDPTDPRHQAVPPPYCNAYCLESPKKTGRSSLGYPCSTFLVTNREDGRLYCLKRFDSVRSVSAKIAAAVSDQWQAVPPHPGTTPLYACHVFAQRAVCFIHEYVPGARTLLELQQQLALHNNGQTTLWPEPTLWSCVAQLVSAVRAVHAAHRAVRTLRLRHVLATPMLSNGDDNDEDNATPTRWRLRLGSLGIVDALEFESRKNILDLQMEDIRDLGRLILSLASGTDVTSTGTGGGASSANGNATIDRFAPFLAQHYSRDLHNLTMTLIKSTPHPPTIADISRAMAGHCFEEQAAAYTALDRAERALAAEYNSGRAMRLLLKLGYVNERPEFGHNRRWAQSGDCYILSLFRDYGKCWRKKSRSTFSFSWFIMIATHPCSCEYTRLLQCSTRPTPRAIPSWISATSCRHLTSSMRPTRKRSS
jgi:PAB-dependent poly(A)-specific ribonuclease subunit 3